MIALALLLAAPVQDAAAEEVVVISQRLRAWRANIRIKKGVVRCTIKKSAGDAAIDRIGCDSMTQCFTAMAPRFDAIQDKKLSATTRKAMQADVNRDVTACVTQKRDTMIADLADRRAAAKE